MNINGWWVRENAFIKCFMDYTVRVQDVKTPNDVAHIHVSIWKDNGYKNTMKTFAYHNFEDAFKFVEEFAEQKFFDQLIEKEFFG